MKNTTYHAPFPHILGLLLIFFIGVVTFSCSDDGDSVNKDYTSARVSMATELASGIIVPGYEKLDVEAGKLVSAVEAFLDDPDETHLNTVQAQLRTVRLAWQRVAHFQFGPAEQNALRSTLNTYPVDTALIEENISSGNYVIGSINNLPAEGFAAVGYLVHGSGNNTTEVIDAFADDTSGQRAQYLRALAVAIDSGASAVLEGWSSGYTGEFTGQAARGTDAGSSLSLLVNAMEWHLQRFVRDGKVGIPAGVRSAGIPRPSSTEAYYAQYSVDLLVEALTALRDTYLGQSEGAGDFYGLQDYLIELESADLATEIQVQFDEAITLAAQLNQPLSADIENDLDRVLGVWLEMQELVPMLKADMASVMGVIITNQDADGD